MTMGGDRQVLHEKVTVSHRSRILSVFLSILPSFLHTPLLDIPSKPARISPTAWLDGMRGLAAFFVFLRHFEFAYHRKGAIAYGTVRDPDFPNQNTFFLQLPIVRLVNSGEAMVAIFFVISGYALSYKSLKLIRKSCHDQLLRVLASSIFRRPLRLFLPCVASTFIVFLALRVGLYDGPNTIAGPEDVFRSIFLGWAHDPQPYVLGSFWEQARDWAYETSRLLNVFTHTHWPDTRYDVHLWTIPIEFKCSLVLFLTIGGLALVRSRVRMIVLAVFIALSFQLDNWDLGAFWGGMFLAEASLIRIEKIDNRVKSEPFSSEKRKSSGGWNTFFIYCGFFLSLYLLSYPFQEAEFAPGYSTLAKLVPSGMRADERYRFWHCIGAFLLIYTTSCDISLQSVFSCALGRYLGNISFSLYLMHGFILKTAGYASVYSFWQLTGKETLWQYEWGFVLGGLIAVPLSVCAADLFWRHIDKPIVKFSRWLEVKLMPPPENMPSPKIVEPRDHQP